MLYLHNLSTELGINFQKIQSWFLNKEGFKKDKEKEFFQNNNYIQDVKPIIKWVG